MFKLMSDNYDLHADLSINHLNSTLWPRSTRTCNRILTVYIADADVEAALEYAGVKLHKKAMHASRVYTRLK